MQLFVRGSETHALQLAGNETVSDIKVIVLERVRHRKTPIAIRPIKKLCVEGNTGEQIRLGSRR